MIAINQLTFHYKKQPALFSDLSFQQENGSITGLLGENGAGKSTLLNLLTGAAVAAENKLFATLDPTTRNLTLPNHQRLLLTDTVGFLRKLPHTLIE